jgi:hypothetical protein
MTMGAPANRIPAPGSPRSSQRGQAWFNRIVDIAGLIANGQKVDFVGAGAKAGYCDHCSIDDAEAAFFGLRSIT